MREPEGVVSLFFQIHKRQTLMEVLTETGLLGAEKITQWSAMHEFHVGGPDQAPEPIVSEYCLQSYKRGRGRGGLVPQR